MPIHFILPCIYVILNLFIRMEQKTEMVSRFLAYSNVNKYGI
jgi:hypothetical protein